MINSPEVIHLIENASLFRGVSHGILDSLYRKSNLVSLKQGEKLLSPGTINEKVYILISGRLSVQATPSIVDEPIAMLTPGECVGEMSVLVDGMVSAYVIAISDCELLSMDYSSFWSLIDGSNEAARNMLNILVQRIRLGNEIMADSLLNQNPIADHDIIDSLTGLYNNHGMNRKFERLLNHCVTGKCPLYLVILEIDKPEKIMNTTGKLRDDQTMRSIAQTMLTFLRPDDHAARLPGKRFAALLTNLSPAEASATADRLKVAISQAHIIFPDGSKLPHISMSTGVSEARPEDTWNSLVARSDIVLKQAQARGA